MSNSYFQFKRFTIEQAQCANKVSTDACVFGALVAQHAAGKTILDVGCGSALLSLMAAQGNAQKVVGVEIEKSCALQAAENVKKSPWADRVNIIHSDIHEFSSDERFNFIISNPPFFNNSSKNPNEKRNLARQTESLGPASWPLILEHHLAEKGLCSFLLSNNDVLSTYKDILSKTKFSFMKEIKLFDKKNAPCKRVLLFVSAVQIDLELIPTICYKNVDATYSKEMISLLSKFYLNL